MELDRKTYRWDYLLLLVTLCLVGIGLVMVLSSSSMLGEKNFGDPYHYFRPQVMYALLGLMIMLLCRNIPYQILCRLSFLILVGTLTLLVLVLVPAIGHEAGGASRWLRLGFFSIQPSELAKLVLVLYLARSLTMKREEIKSFTRGLLPLLVVLGSMVGLVLLEPDLGAAVVLVLLALFMFFVGGIRLSFLISLMVMALPAVYYLIIRSPYRMRRIAAFLTPWDDPLGTGYHIIHSYMAFASGGLTGTGPGGGHQKLFFLPEPHTDFIFSVVGEELGFIGVVFVALLFLILVWRGLSVALNAYEIQGTYLALGLTLIIGIQAFMNMGVVVGLLPTKGLILPFFSYGGSAMVVSFASIGILLNIAGQGRSVALPDGNNKHV